MEPVANPRRRRRDLDTQPASPCAPSRAHTAPVSFEETTTYSSTVDEVIAYLTDADRLVGRYEAMGDTNVEVLRCEPDGDDLVIELRRDVTIDLPGFAKKVLGETNTTIQREHWAPVADDGSRRASYEIEAQGTPVRTIGTFLVEPNGNGARHVVTGRMEVKVPLIGGRLGSFLDGTARDRVKSDFAHNKDTLG